MARRAYCKAKETEFFEKWFPDLPEVVIAARRTCPTNADRTLRAVPGARVRQSITPDS